jgi:hypothetical protein
VSTPMLQVETSLIGNKNHNRLLWLEAEKFDDNTGWLKKVARQNKSTACLSSFTIGISCLRFLLHSDDNETFQIYNSQRDADQK